MGAECTRGRSGGVFNVSTGALGQDVPKLAGWHANFRRSWSISECFQRQFFHTAPVNVLKNPFFQSKIFLHTDKNEISGKYLKLLSYKRTRAAEF